MMKGCLQLASEQLWQFRRRLRFYHWRCLSSGRGACATQRDARFWAVIDRETLGAYADHADAPESRSHHQWLISSGISTFRAPILLGRANLLRTGRGSFVITVRTRIRENLFDVVAVFVTIGRLLDYCAAVSVFGATNVTQFVEFVSPHLDDLTSCTQSRTA